MAEKRTITTTKNYRLFSLSKENRDLKLPKRKKLFSSMEKYGFLHCFPIVCVRKQGCGLVVIDGQHRLAIAESLGLPVHYTVSSAEFDIAEINCTSEKWRPRDYAERFAANRIESYVEGLAFVDEHGIAVGVAFAMLAGTTTFSNIRADFESGRFVVRDREWATSVANIYNKMIGASSAIKGSNFLKACMAICRVDEFDPERLVSNAERCRERLASYSTRDAYLHVLEDVYNFGRHKVVPLRSLALRNLRKRSGAGRVFAA